MKKITAAFIFICFCCSAFGQVPPPPPPDPNSTPTAPGVGKDTSKVNDFTAIEEVPEFPGGQQAMMNYLARNIMYPQIEREMGIQGKVYISFIIEKNGSISNVTVLKGVNGGKGLEKEAMRVISMMPKWSPGKQNGKTVRVRFNIPISFKLNDDQTPSAQLPIYPGGAPAMLEYLNKNLKYPEKALKKKKEGYAVVSYCVDLSGNVTDVKISNSTDKIFNEEAVRLVKEMPKWVPGKGQNAPQPETITVTFKLPSSK